MWLTVLFVLTLLLGPELQHLAHPCWYVPTKQPAIRISY